MDLRREGLRELPEQEEEGEVWQEHLSAANLEDFLRPGMCVETANRMVDHLIGCEDCTRRLNEAAASEPPEQEAAALRLDGRMAAYLTTERNS